MVGLFVFLSSLDVSFLEYFKCSFQELYWCLHYGLYTAYVSLFHKHISIPRSPLHIWFEKIKETSVEHLDLLT